MYEDIGRSLSTDYFLIADQLTREELSYLQRTRDFVRGIAGHQRHWERAEFPWPVVEKLAKLGIVGYGIHGSCTWSPTGATAAWARSWACMPGGCSQAPATRWRGPHSGTQQRRTRPAWRTQSASPW